MAAQRFNAVMTANHLVAHFQSTGVKRLLIRDCTNGRYLTPGVSHLIDYKVLTFRARRATASPQRRAVQLCEFVLP